MRSDAQRELIERLVDEARPVAPLWSPAARLAIWVGVAAVVFLLTAWAGLRPDVAERCRDPLFWLELVPLLGAGVALAALALRAAVPGREPTRRDVAVAAALIGIAALFSLRLPIRTDVSVAQFAHAGVGCAVRITVLAALPWATLIVAVRRGAPFAAGTAGALAGAAAFVVAFAMMRLVCGLDDLLHIVMWHAGPIIVGTTISTVVGTAWLSRWKRGLRP